MLFLWSKLYLIPRRFAAAPRGTGERTPPLRFAHPLRSAYGLLIPGLTWDLPVSQPRLHLKSLVGQIFCNRGKGNAPFGPNRCRVFT